MHHGYNPEVQGLEGEAEWYKYGADGIEKVSIWESERVCEMEPWQKREEQGDSGGEGAVSNGFPVHGACSNQGPTTHLLILWASSASFIITGEDLTGEGRSSRRYQSLSIFDSAGSWCGIVEITDRDWADRLPLNSASSNPDWADNLTPKSDNSILCEFIGLSRRNDLSISMKEMDFRRWDSRREWGVWNVMMCRGRGS